MTRPIFLILMILSICHIAFSQKIPKKLKPHLEENSEVIDINDGYTVEKVDDSTYIVKTYLPKYQGIIKNATFLDQDLTTAHGYYMEFNSSGDRIRYGKFVNGWKHGNWFENQYDRGFYVAGKREGTWTTYFPSGKIMRKFSYINDQLQDTAYIYNEEGQIVDYSIFERDSLIFSTISDSSAVQTPPLFEGDPSCFEKENNQEMIQCAESAFVKKITQNLSIPPEYRDVNLLDDNNQLEFKIEHSIKVEKDGSFQINFKNNDYPLLNAQFYDLVSEIQYFKPATKGGFPVAGKLNDEPIVITLMAVQRNEVRVVRSFPRH